MGRTLLAVVVALMLRARERLLSLGVVGGSKWLLIAVLAVGTVAVSTAAPLIELSGIPKLSIAAWRTLLCGAVYAVFAAVRRESLMAAARTGGVRMLVAAALLGAHFALWISAFDHTSYAAAVLLLVTQPMFGAVLGRMVYRETLGPRTIAALLISATGLYLLVQEDFGAGQDLFGDVLAIVGSLAIALYYIAVKPLRTALPFVPFMALTYGAGGVMLAGLALATGDAMVGFPAVEWAVIAALALLPTVVGHACFNWAVPRVRFFTLNLLIVLEPAIALLLGAWLLHESATTTELLGGAVLAAAVLVGAWRRRTQIDGVEGP